MKVAFCVAVKNRGCCIVEKEDSIQHMIHVLDKIEVCPEHRIQPMETKDGKVALPLLPRMVASLVKQKKEADDWVLVVVDYKSTDISVREVLEIECGTRLPWHLETIEEYPFFDRGGGLAKAAEIAEKRFSADAVFFCDADLEFKSRDLFDEMYTSFARNQFFYPIFFSFASPDHTIGLWRDTSFGNFACLLQDYKKTEGWYHNISWGWEDRALADSIPETKKDRKRIRGFFHQWHPVQWDFRVREYPVKEYMFKGAAVKDLEK
jgi:glycosyltransferase involved in cell wall biosynthesis